MLVELDEVPVTVAEARCRADFTALCWLDFGDFERLFHVKLNSTFPWEKNLVKGKLKPASSFVSR